MAFYSIKGLTCANAYHVQTLGSCCSMLLCGYWDYLEVNFMCKKNKIPNLLIELL